MEPFSLFLSLSLFVNEKQLEKPEEIPAADWLLRATGHAHRPYRPPFRHFQLARVCWGEEGAGFHSCASAAERTKGGEIGAVERRNPPIRSVPEREPRNFSPRSVRERRPR